VHRARAYVAELLGAETFRLLECPHGGRGLRAVDTVRSRRAEADAAVDERLLHFADRLLRSRIPSADVHARAIFKARLE
jgi:hypothetical protein